MRQRLRHIVGMILIFALVLVIPFASVQEVNAAAKKSGPKKVTVHLVTDESVSKAVDKSLQYVTFTKSTYNKKGLRTKYVTSNNKGGMEKVKIKYNRGNRRDIMDNCQIMGARIVDMSRNLMMIEMCDTPERVAVFMDILKSFSVVEITRTGVLAMTKCGENS